MNLQLIIAAIVAALGFGSAWQIQDWRYKAKESERVQLLLAEREAQAARALRNSDNVIAAQNAAAARIVALRRDGDAVRNALSGLQHAADEALRRAKSGHDASLNTAAAAVNILKQCGKEYAGLAEVADRHVSDIKTLEAAWPR